LIEIAVELEETTEESGLTKPQIVDVSDLFILFIIPSPVASASWKH
jgi:hypothetical protein